jgi:hypothetical protein
MVGGGGRREKKMSKQTWTVVQVEYLQMHHAYALSGELNRAAGRGYGIYSWAIAKVFQ